MDLTSKYYADICKAPILSKEQEGELFREFYLSTTSESRRKEIRNLIVESNLRFVFKTARNFCKNETHLLRDLISAGNEGLLVGFDKYNPNSGVRFLSYAGWWVQQRILSAMSKVRIVALPVWKQQLASRIQKASINQEDITVDELSEIFPDIQEKDIREMHGTKYLTFYIDDLDYQNSTEFQINPVEDDVERELDAATLRSAVAKLESPYREIISCSYGLSEGKDYKPYQLAKKMGIPKDTLEDVLKEGLRLLREQLQVKELE